MRKVYIEINYGKNNGKMGNRKTFEKTEGSIRIYSGRNGRTAGDIRYAVQKDGKRKL